MPAGKIKESLWLGMACIFLSSAQGQGGVRQLDGALRGLWGLGWPPKPKRPRVQVPAESNQGEIWECHSCSQQRCSVAQLSLSLSVSLALLSHFYTHSSVACTPPPYSLLHSLLCRLQPPSLLFLTGLHTRKTAYFKHEAKSTLLLVCVWAHAAFVCLHLCACVCLSVCKWGH